jgi:hypothetical protein
MDQATLDSLMATSAGCAAAIDGHCVMLANVRAALTQLTVAIETGATDGEALAIIGAGDPNILQALHRARRELIATEVVTAVVRERLAKRYGLAVMATAGH